MGVRKWFRSLFRARTLSSWFHVRFDETTVHIEAEPPGRNPWKDSFRWEDIVRVVYEVEGAYLSDGIYIFTKKRPESYAIPVEADGGPQFWRQLLKLGYFDPALAKKIPGATGGRFEWPTE
jgi:hypothetical protein